MSAEQKREGGSSTLADLIARLEADLIARLEKAAASDREIDEAIHVLVTGKPVRQSCEHCGTSSMWFPREYTASLDAALTLVPEGYGFLVSDRAPEPHAGRAWVHNRKMVESRAYRGSETTAHTPAIALCVAALKARSAIIAAVGARPAEPT